MVDTVTVTFFVNSIRIRVKMGIREFFLGRKRTGMGEATKCLPKCLPNDLSIHGSATIVNSWYGRNGILSEDAVAEIEGLAKNSE